MTALLSWPGRWLSAGLLAGGLFASPAWATTFQLQPRDLGAGFSFAGTLTTDGTVGALDAGNVLAWDIVVTQTAEIHYTPQNTFSPPAWFYVRGADLVVPTSPDGVADGGQLNFFGGMRSFVQVASFTGSSAATGGVAFFVYADALDTLHLNQAPGTEYVAANLLPGNRSVFGIRPLTFPGGASLSGTLTTLGRDGPATLVDWDVQVSYPRAQWHFEPFNSQILAGLGLATDGLTLTVSPLDALKNPGSFIVGSQGSGGLSTLTLAGFAPGPQVEFLASGITHTLDGLAMDPAGRLVVATAVPEPAAWALMGAGLALLGLWRRRRR